MGGSGTSRVTGRVKPPTGCMTFKIKANSLEAPLCLINVRLIAWKSKSFYSSSDVIPFIY